MKINTDFFKIAATIQLKLRNKYELLNNFAILIFHKKGGLIKLWQYGFPGNEIDNFKECRSVWILCWLCYRMLHFQISNSYFFSLVFWSKPMARRIYTT